MYNGIHTLSVWIPLYIKVRPAQIARGGCFLRCFYIVSGWGAGVMSE